jgi:hypothetical protein
MGLNFGQDFAQSLVKGPVGKYISPGPLELFEKEQRSKLLAFSRQTSAFDMLTNYFAGKNLSINKTDIDFEASSPDMDIRRRLRRGVVGTKLGIAGANVLGINPFGVTDQLNNLSWLATHATIGMGLFGMKNPIGKVAGIGYLGATLINTFRSGDNFGPL